MAEVLNGGEGRGEWRMAADLNVPWRAGDTELPSRHHTPPTHQPQCLASKFHAVAPLLCALSLSLTFSGAWCSWIPQPSDARIHWVPLTAKGWWRWGGVRIWGAEMKQERPALLLVGCHLGWAPQTLWVQHRAAGRITVAGQRNRMTCYVRKCFVSCLTHIRLGWKLKFLSAEGRRIAAGRVVGGYR